MNDIANKEEVGVMVAQVSNEPLPQILIIEDNFDHLELLGHYLNRYRVNVRVAQSGWEGWAIVQEEQIDLLILDYTLPDLDGLAFLKKLRLHAWQRPVVMMTTIAERWLTDEICRHGANHFVQKTITGGFLQQVGEIVARELRLQPRQELPVPFRGPAIAGRLHQA